MYLGLRRLGLYGGQFGVVLLFDHLVIYFLLELLEVAVLHQLRVFFLGARPMDVLIAVAQFHFWPFFCSLASSLISVVPLASKILNSRLAVHVAQVASILVQLS